MTLRKSLLATSILAATLGLTACGGSSNNDTTTPTTPTTPTNAAPTNITLTASEAGVKENVSVAQEVGTLAATDADSTAFTFTTADERFTIEGTKLSVKEGTVFDFEAGATVEVEVTVNDGTNNFTKKIEINIVDEMDYDFRNASSGESSVAYSGQIARHVMIKELSNYIKGDFAKDNVNDADKINQFYKIGEYKDKADLEGVSFVNESEAKALYSEIWGSKAVTISAFSETSKQKLLTDISGSHKDLYGKVAGNDFTGQMKNWNLENSLAGWEGLTAENNTPRGLVDELFKQLRENAKKIDVDGIGDGSLAAPNGKQLDLAYVTDKGVDLQQLIEKFLFGAVAFSQAADDYLDDDGGKTSKGLRSNHVEFDGKAYTALEHQWDEGFGYFGAARNYLSYSDNEIASGESKDTDGSGDIDLLSEYNWGNSGNAAKRDKEIKVNDTVIAGTDLTKEAFVPFYEGRKLLSETAGTELTAEQKKDLAEHAKKALLGWEKAIVATVIHYINYVLDKDDKGDIDHIKSGDYELSQFYALAKHWSEMKGFALNMQFNPVSPFVATEEGKAKFVELHKLMGVQPELDPTKIDAYKADLIKARDILAQSYTWYGKDGKELTAEELKVLVENW